MLKAQVPHTIVKGANFLKDPAVRDAQAYMRLTLNPKDNAAFQRVFNKPCRKLGKPSPLSMC